MVKTFVFFLSLLCVSRVLASDIKSVETFDIYAAPLVGASSGSYKADDKFEGSFAGLHYGARIGFKLGPILIGGEFARIEQSGSSSKNEFNQADRDKYDVSRSGSITSVGGNLGLYTDRVVLWANFYPATGLDTKIGLNDYTHKGKSYSAELNFRVWNRLYLGAFGMRTELSEYDSGASKGLELDPSLKLTTYGMTISYLFPLSELKKLKGFPGLE